MARQILMTLWERTSSFLRTSIEKTDSFDFVGDSCQKLGIRKDILVQIKKYANAFVLKSGY